MLFIGIYPHEAYRVKMLAGFTEKILPWLCAVETIVENDARVHL